MGKGAKLLLGLGLGLLVVFAAIGIKSMMGSKPLQTPDTGFVPVVPVGSEPQATAPISGTTPLDPNLSKQDTGTTTGTEKIDVTLEGEPDQPATNTEDTTNSAQTNPNQPTTATTPPTQTTAPPNTSDTTAQVGMSGSSLDMPTPTQDPAQIAESYGKLTINVVDPSSSGKVNGDFLVYDSKGLQVASFSGSDSASFDLAPGDYKVSVSANGKQSSRQLSVYTDKLTTARFELASSPSTQQSTATTPDKVELAVSVRAAESNAPIKANIYVQTTNGRHIARKDYDDVAEFLLEPGVYRVTVKAKGRQDASREVRVGRNGKVSENFELQAIAGSTTQQTQTPTQRPNPTPPQTSNQGASLRLSLTSAIGLPDKAQFTVRDMNGNRIANLGPIGSTELKLPPGRYEVTASLERGIRETRTIDLTDGRTTQVTFSADGILQQSNNNPDQEEFRGRDRNRDRDRGERGDIAQAEPQASGRLQLNAVSGVDGSPLRVNFVVTSMDGRAIKSFTNVAYGEVNLPPQDVRVQIRYEDMNGTEVIRVKPNEPTVYTFTISPKRQQQPQEQQPAQIQDPMQFPFVQPPPGVDENTLRQIQEEIQRRLTN